MGSSDCLKSYLNKGKVKVQAEKKKKEDKVVRILLFILALLSASAVIFIVLFLAIQGLKPFFKIYITEGKEYRVPFREFLFGNQFEPGPNRYGSGYILVNTFYITLLTMILVMPVSVLTALVIVKMSPKPIGILLNGAIEVLASVPSVIFGMFGKARITQFVKWLASLFHYQTAGGLSVLSVVLVLTMMSVPTVTMLSISAIKSVSHSLELGSLALGASKSQTNFKVVLTSAKGGIFAGMILGVSKALGEATAITMVSGQAGSGPSFSLLDTTSTLTTTMLSGLGEASGSKYDIKFSLGLLLIFVILISNLLLQLFNARLEKGGKKA